MQVFDDFSKKKQINLVMSKKCSIFAVEICEMVYFNKLNIITNQFFYLILKNL